MTTLIEGMTPADHWACIGVQRYWDSQTMKWGAYMLVEGYPEGHPAWWLYWMLVAADTEAA